MLFSSFEPQEISVNTDITVKAVKEFIKAFCPLTERDCALKRSDLLFSPYLCYCLAQILQENVGAKTGDEYFQLHDLEKIPRGEKCRELPFSQQRSPSSCKNFETLLKQIREYYNKQQRKGVLLSGLLKSRNESNKGQRECFKGSLRSQHELSIHGLESVVGLVLCVLISCEDSKSQAIQKIMSLSQETQQYLAKVIQQTQLNKICEFEQQEKMEILEELRSEEEANRSLLAEVEEYSLNNSELRSKVEYLQRQLERFQKKQKSNKLRHVLSLGPKLHSEYSGDNFHGKSEIQFDSKSKIPEMDSHSENSQSSVASFTSSDESERILSRLPASLSSTRLPISMDEQITSNLHHKEGSYDMLLKPRRKLQRKAKESKQEEQIQALRQRLVTQESQYQEEMAQMERHIQQLEEELQKYRNYDEIFSFAESRHSQQIDSLTIKIDLVEKEKAKLKHQLFEKDIIIESLEDKVIEINENYVMLEQQKADLEALMSSNHRKPSSRCLRNNGLVGMTPNTSKGINLTPFSSNGIASKSMVVATSKQVNFNEKLLDCTSQQNAFRQLKQQENARILSVENSGFQQNLETSIMPPKNESLKATNACEQIGASLSELAFEQFLQGNESIIEENKLRVNKLEKINEGLVRENEKIKTKLLKHKKLELENRKLTQIIVEMTCRQNDESELLMATMMELYKESTTKEKFKAPHRQARKESIRIDQGSSRVFGQLQNVLSKQRELSQPSKPSPFLSETQQGLQKENL